MRQAHWIRLNHQERIPPRMVAFDTESRSTYDNEIESQEWRVGCAIRWRNDLSTGPHEEAAVFDNPRAFWEWVARYTRKGTRTVVWAHNLGHDVRISRMFEELPRLGYRLEWCNLDRNISSATWRSENGTIVLADTWTWIPLPLSVIAPQVGMVKYRMPGKTAKDDKWASYCMKDAEILYNVVRRLIAFVKDNNLGNWQPTGAGMALATWRHRFLKDKVLVHDDVAALAAERSAMHTGRAEAWRHGKLYGDEWTEVDLRNAYLTISAECQLPRKLHMSFGAISARQYSDLRGRFALLCRVHVDTELPILPYRCNGRHYWPTGQFETWVWDTEIDTALRYGAKVKVLRGYAYAESPLLQEWARWTLDLLRNPDADIDPVVKTHVKHCSRALIGRIALRTPSWEVFGANPEGITGITHVTMPGESRTTRLLHVGDTTLIETERNESENSLPQITGKIMAECRSRLWDMMHIAGLDNIAHVDTDSVLVNSWGLANLKTAYGADFDRRFSIKGTYRRLDMWGPRAYYRDSERVVSGIPKAAKQTATATFAGEQWEALSASLERDSGRSVAVRPAIWHLTRVDPRRTDAPGGRSRTAAYAAAALTSSNMSSAPASGAGA